MALTGSLSTTSTTLKGSLRPDTGLNARSLAVGTAGKFLELTDIDPVDLNDGAVVIYNESKEKFEIKREMDNPNTKIIGGTF